MTSFPAQWGNLPTGPFFKTSASLQPGTIWQFPAHLPGRQSPCVTGNSSGNGPSAYRPKRRAQASAIFSSKRSEEHTSELQSRLHLVCRLLLEKKKQYMSTDTYNTSTSTS